MKSFIKRLRNISLVFVLLIWQVVFAGAPLIQSNLAHATALSSTDVGFSSVGFVLSGNYSVVNSQPTGAGSLKNGNVGAYPEGACIPAQFDVTNNSKSAGDTTISPIYDYYDNGVVGISNYEKITTPLTGDPSASADNLNDFNFTGQSLTADTSFQTSSGATVSATVTGPYSGEDAGTSSTSSTDAQRHYNIALSNIPAGDTVYILLCARLSLDASQYPGSSLSMRTVQGGKENVPIPVNQILVLPSITVTKTVVGGSATASDFTFTISPDPNNTEGTTYTIPSGQSSVTIPNVNPDGTYGITESGGDGNYTFTSGTGTNCSPEQSTIGTSAGKMTATVAAGKTPTNATCNFTNSLKPSSLTVVKDVVNDNGGTLTADTFAVKVNDTQLSGGVLSNSNLTDTYTYSNPQSGTPYTISEDSPTASGYAQTSLVCKDNDTHATVDNPVTLNPGQNVTCTITNDDIAPQLNVIKHVINDNGGGKLASDFTMDVTGINVSDSSFAGAESPGTTVTLNAGSYSVDEGSHDGYNETKSADCSGTISVGETKTCTITNNDIAPSVTVFKDVVNPYGGTTLQPSDFPIFIDGTQVTIAVPTTQFGAGSHTITETQQPGYEFTGVSGDCTYINSTITLSMDIGGTYTCTITNSAIQPKLTVIKHVINDNGGTKSAGDFTMDVSDNSVSVPNFPGDEKGTTVGLNVGDYSVDETSHDGYAESFSGDCTGTVVLGDTKTCTITNNDIAPSLTLNKIVSNTHGGTAQPSNWTLTATGPTTLSGQGPTVSSDSTFSAGTYSLSESGGPSGYSASSWSCTNGVIPVNNEITLDNGESTSCTITNSDIAPTLTVTKVVVNPFGTALDPTAFPLFVDGIQVTTGVPTTQFSAGKHTVTETQQSGYTLTDVSGDCSQSNGTISLTLAIGGSSTCTLTNTAIQPKLTVIKHVINDNSGAKSASDFTMTVTGNSIGTLSFPGNESGTTVGLNEGGYTVGESSHIGYAETFSGDCDGSISIGETKTCTITNNDVPNPGIHIVKSGPSVAHEGDKVTYTFTVTNTGDIALSNVAVNDDVAGGANYVSGDTNHNNLLDTNETWIFTKDYTIPTPRVADVINTAQACGDFSDGTTSGTGVCDTDMHTLDVIHPAIQVEKFGPATAFQGQTVTYTFWVTNTGDTELHDVGIADDLATGETCNDNVLASGDSTSCTATYTIPNDQTGDVTNHVTASGTDQLDETVTGTDQHTLTVLVPGIQVVKTGPSSAAAGSTVTYTFTVTNTGNTPLDSITVNDDIAGQGVYQSGDTNSNDELDMNETWIYTANYTIPKDQFNSVTNTVTACGTASIQQEEELQILDTQISDNSKTVCAQDNHTLVIPKVLAEVTPPQVLANTGQSAWAGVVAGLTMLSLVLGINIAFGRQAKKQR